MDRHTNSAEMNLEDSPYHWRYLGFSMATIIALSSMWIGLFSASEGILPQADTFYDFIVVGGGTAGCVMAARLSENKLYKVLLLEAGPEEPWYSHLPLSSVLLQRSRYDWGYFTEQQTNSTLGMKSRRSYWPRGKMMGGSGQINYNIFTLGDEQQYKKWQQRQSLTGWESEQLKPFVKKMICGREDDLDSSASDISVWGVTCPDGSANIHKERSIGNKVFDEAVKNLDPPLTPTSVLTSISQGRRHSTLNRYLKTVYGRKNLHVIVSATVKQVILDDSKRVVGVEWYQYGNVNFTRHTYARGEVILSGGVIGSPVILMRSGVGQVKQLEEMEISTVVSSPSVGQNLRDHLNLPVFVSSPLDEFDKESEFLSLDSLFRYWWDKEGPLAQSGITGMVTKHFPTVENISLDITSVSSDRQNASSDRHNASSDRHNASSGSSPVTPDSQSTSPVSSIATSYFTASDAFNTKTSKTNVSSKKVSTSMDKFPTSFDRISTPSEGSPAFKVTVMMLTMNVTDRSQYSLAANFEKETFDGLFPDIEGKDGFFLVSSCLNPQSKGRVTLNPEGTYDSPLIQPQYLSMERDVRCLAEGFRLIEDIVHTPSMRKINASLHYPNMEECREGRKEGSSQSLSDGELACLIRTASFTGYHPIGTNRMGADGESVVDLELKVRGVSNLRIADASVIPSHFSAAPNAFVTLVAEKGAHMVKEEWTVHKLEENGRSLCHGGVCGEELLYSSGCSSLPPLLTLHLLLYLSATFFAK